MVQIMHVSFGLECEKNENEQKEAGIGPFVINNSNVKEWLFSENAK